MELFSILSNTHIILYYRLLKIYRGYATAYRERKGTF